VRVWRSQWKVAVGEEGVTLLFDVKNEI